MKQEYSYGAVVYRIEEGKRLYLIEKMRLGHVSLPKGHIEKGETPRQCAMREIKEETGLDVLLDTSYGHTVSYSPAPGVNKDVTFYLAKVSSGTPTPQIEEVSEILFLPFEEARDLLTYDSDKETLSLADSYLSRMQKRLTREENR